MNRRILCILTSLMASTGVIPAQSFVTDQFRLLVPGLSLTEARIYAEPFDFAGPCHLESTITGEMVSSFLCEGEPQNTNPEPDGSQGSGLDAAGNLYHAKVRNRELLPSDPCNFSGSLATDFEIERITATGSESIIRILGCVPVSTTRIQVTRLRNLSIDSVNGHAYVAVLSTISDVATGQPQGAWGIVRIAGLPTLLDIITTFQPAGGTLSWLTPKHPEALAAADRFQVYAGDLADLPDFGRAVAVDCAVPDAGSPRPGDLMSILDPLPRPAIGRGTFVVIGVEHAGQRRFGRQYVGGVLSGRDPSAFTGCS